MSTRGSARKKHKTSGSDEVATADDDRVLRNTDSKLCSRGSDQEVTRAEALEDERIHKKEA